MASPRLKTDRLVVLAIAASLAAATVLYYLIQRTRGLTPRLASDKALLAGLGATVVVLFLGLAFVLIRNLILLVVQRRAGVLGSRFRLKLVFVFVFLLMIPSLGLFVGAIAVIDRGLDDLATPPVDRLVESAEWMAEKITRLEQARAAHFGRRVAEQIVQRGLLRPHNRRGLEQLLRREQTATGLGLLGVYRGDGAPRAETEIPPRWRQKVDPLELVEMPRGAIEDVMQTGLPSSRRDDLSYGSRLAALTPVASADGEGVAAVVVAGYYMGPGATNQLGQVRAASSEYQDTVERRPAVKRLYIVVFALLTVLVLFAGVWTGHLLARQITDPISSLVEGTRAISQGDLSHRVDAAARDEIGFLIESFNRMTAELQRSSAEIAERRRYIETLLENAPVGVISLDPEGRVTTVNRAALRIMRLDPGEAVNGQPAAGLLRDEHLATLRETIDRFRLEGDGTVQKEFEFEHQGHLVGISAILGRLRGARGESLGTLVVLEDLTALLRAERQAAWREVARRIAHEIKNPLTPIQLSAQRILKKHREGAPDLGVALEDGASTIVREVGALKGMVDEFSRFARMPALQLHPTDPHDVVREALALYRPHHPGVRFHVDLDPGPARIPADREALKRVLVNLVDNALAAVDGNGALEIRTRSLPAADLFRLEVADDGPGIPAEDKEKLFMPYFSTKRRGTGLGLAIVYRIVTEHGGDIRVEDRHPRGTRFVIEFPAEARGSGESAARPTGEEARRA
jgi:two-component system nitrogen regulation sensor histidine kinase NtrY